MRKYRERTFPFWTEAIAVVSVIVSVLSWIVISGAQP